MKKKLLIFSTFLILLCLLLVMSCNKKPKDTNDITTFLKNIESYTTQMSMDVKNERQTINYNATQSYLRGGGYKLELNGDRVFIYKTDDNIYVSDKNSGTHYIQSKDFDEVFKLSFIGEYIGLLYTNEEIKYTIETKNGIEYTVINLFIPNNNKNINNALLYVNSKSMIPEKMIIYDIKGKEKLHITYTNFIPNAKVEPSEFLIP
ncbi:germination lipoprotein GerS-related protein [Clostridium sp.]|jgi:outer membrane lipoprotein-sorting protein|uniref:germination lipoprotein GerS-related protein n=1 Tax=Clostridium sp. TaxID=1506 RepID=UPI003EE9A549